MLRHGLNCHGEPQDFDLPRGHYLEIRIYHSLNAVKESTHLWFELSRLEFRPPGSPSDPGWFSWSDL